jgi:hypothetical protein
MFWLNYFLSLGLEKTKYMSSFCLYKQYYQPEQKTQTAGYKVGRRGVVAATKADRKQLVDLINMIWQASWRSYWLYFRIENCVMR